MVMDEEGSLIDDIRDGVLDSELMEKYHLSAVNLRRKILQLMSEDAVDSTHVYWRPILYDYEVSDGDRRDTPRYPLELLLTVHAIESSESTSGLLIDINEKGGCVKGMRPPLGVTVALRIDTGTRVLQAAEIMLEAVFRWEECVGDCLAGFEIVNISHEDAARLKELIRTIVRG